MQALVPAVIFSSEPKLQGQLFLSSWLEGGH